MSVSVTEPISRVLEELVACIDADLAERVAGLNVPENLREAIGYAVLGGGKRIRPVVVVLCCRAMGGDDEKCLAAAASLEFIHAFSLVHDDLPAMDDDDMRRGRPTLHKHTNEAMAILAGDAMLSLAFQFIADAPLSAKQKGEIVSELGSATTAMIGGQVYDSLGGFPQGISDRDKLELIHQNKTAALIRASCRIGGICGGADGQRLSALTEFGEAIGLMFQIVDDVLDVTQSTEHLGKTAGKDHDAGKLTFPALIGIESSRTEIGRLHKAALAALEPLGEDAVMLRRLCDYMAVRTR